MAASDMMDLKYLKSLMVVFFIKLRGTVISSAHEMYLWLLFLTYLGKFKANFEVLDFFL